MMKQFSVLPVHLYVELNGNKVNLEFLLSFSLFYTRYKVHFIAIQLYIQMYTATYISYVQQ